MAHDQSRRTPTALFEKITHLPNDQIAKLAKRRDTLRRSLAGLNARLADFSPRERDAALSLLYAEIIDSIFDFHACLEHIAACRRASGAKTMSDRVQMVQEYRTVIDALGSLYEDA
jgi:hypothetical protein